MDKDEVLKLIKIELDGICDTQGDYDDGWWETSTGAAFGKKRLDNVLKIVAKALESQEEYLKELSYQTGFEAGRSFERSCREGVQHND